jgi:hypothetical protein
MTPRTLHLAKNLSLPVDAVTQTIAILAKRRAGKSYTMRRLAEQLFQAGQQIVLVDPKGDQWGIRSAADGRAPGLPITILGGERGDVPLEASAGEVVAKLVVEERVSVVLDLSLFRKHEVATFMTAFLENVYRLKAREQYRTPMMLVIDEADAIAPQKPQKGEERMLGAAEDIVRRGGQRGIGCVLVTQRSAVLNKNVLTQAQMLVALRTIAPQDLAAMNAWIDVHGTEEQKRTLMESLPSLPVGDAWFWSPGWPDVDGIFQRVHVLPIETFDSGATPKAGEKRVEPKKPADVDLEALKRQMAATIEKAKADDPRELRRQLAATRAELAKKEKVLAEVDARTKRIDAKLQAKTDVADRAAVKTAHTELKAELAKYRRALGEAMKILVKVKAVDFNIDTDEGLKALEQAVAAAVKQVTGSIEKRVTALAERVEGFKKQAGVVEKAIAAILDEKIDLAVTVQKREPFHVDSARQPTAPRGSGKPQAASDGAGGDLPPGERAVLTAALQYPGLDRTRLTILTGYKRSSRDSYIARLAGKGFLEVQGSAVLPTDAGRAALDGSFEPLPSGADLLAYWFARLPEGERKVLELLARHEGQDVDRERISDTTGYKRSSRDSYLVRLKARGLVEFTGPGLVRASQELF